MEQTALKVWTLRYTPACCGLRYLCDVADYVNSRDLQVLQAGFFVSYAVRTDIPTASDLIQIRSTHHRPSHVIWHVPQTMLEEAKVLVKELESMNETVALVGPGAHNAYMMVWS